jgi:hypothetical protein
MSQDTQEDAPLSLKDRIKAHNDALLKRMQDPDDNLKAFNSLESWYPIRKTIKKDLEAMKKLYGKKV